MTVLVWSAAFLLDLFVSKWVIPWNINTQPQTACIILTLSCLQKFENVLQLHAFQTPKLFGFPSFTSTLKFLARLPWTSNEGDFTLLHLPRSFCYLFSVKQLCTSRAGKQFLKCSHLVGQYISVFRNLHYRHESFGHALRTTSLQLQCRY